jgi:hypothetical protein
MTLTTNKNLISNTLALKMINCIEEYEKIKNKKSENFKTVKEFCLFYKFSHQNFMKIYHRYKQNPNEMSSVLPQKRGPKYTTRRIDLKTEERIIELRKLGNNRYEIYNILKSDINNNIDNDINGNNNITINKIPSPTTIYNVFKRHNLNRLNKEEKQEKRKIVMKKAGELVHIDIHQLSKGITIKEPNNIYYLLGIIDDYSRLIWIEVLENKKALTTMFATLKSLNMLKLHYNIETQCIMSDNGAEFGSGKFTNNKEDHPFEVLLKEMNIKHIYTKPYKPQTNGKIERFWKTLKEDCIEDALYEDINDLKDELLKYIVYYNRPSAKFNRDCP